MTSPPAQAGVTQADGRVLVVVEMQQRPAGIVFAEVLEQAAARTAQTIAVAATAARTQVAVVAAEQQQVAAAMSAAPFNAV